MYASASCTRSVCTMNFVGYYRCYTFSQERQRCSHARRKVCSSELLGRGKERAEKVLKIRYGFSFLQSNRKMEFCSQEITRGARERPGPRAYPDQGNLLGQWVHVFINTFSWSASVKAACMTVTSDDCISACWKWCICSCSAFGWSLQLVSRLFHEMNIQRKGKVTLEPLSQQELFHVCHSRVIEKGEKM